MLSQENKSAWQNPWFVGMVLLLVTTVSVNSVFIWYALHHGSSLVDLEYNTKDRKSDSEVLADIQAQNALAWKVTIKQPAKIVLGKSVAYEIDVLDRSGVPVSGKMEVVGYRPSDAGQDFSTPFTEVSSGGYQGYMSFPLKGYWELRIRVKRGKDIFETESDKFIVMEKN
ncbi:MAG: FixH family protein [Gallionella sp.]